MNSATKTWGVQRSSGVWRVECWVLGLELLEVQGPGFGCWTEGLRLQRSEASDLNLIIGLHMHAASMAVLPRFMVLLRLAHAWPPLLCKRIIFLSLSIHFVQPEKLLQTPAIDARSTARITMCVIKSAGQANAFKSRRHIMGNSLHCLL